MSNLLAVLLNGIAQLEYDRNKALPAHQAVYLEKMDAKMDAGIRLGNNTVENQDINHLDQFIDANLLNAMRAKD